MPPPLLLQQTSNDAPSRSPPVHMTQTANIRSPHSLAAILSPTAPPEDSAGVSRATTPKRTHTKAFAGGEQPYLHPASPTQQRASISSTTSPATRGADDGASRAMKGGQEEKKPQKMVRSSIACARCRRYGLHLPRPCLMRDGQT